MANNGIVNVNNGIITANIGIVADNYGSVVISNGSLANNHDIAAFYKGIYQIAGLKIMISNNNLMHTYWILQ